MEMGAKNVLRFPLGCACLQVGIMLNTWNFCRANGTAALMDQQALVKHYFKMADGDRKKVKKNKTTSIHIFIESHCKQGTQQN